MSNYAADLESAGLLSREHGYAVTEPETVLTLLIRKPTRTLTMLPPAGVGEGRFAPRYTRDVSASDRSRLVPCGLRRRYKSSRLRID